MLPVKFAFAKLRPYVEGYHFTVISNSSALTCLNSLTDPTGRLSRWALLLQPYDIDIMHRKGALNYLDVLSRDFNVDRVDAIYSLNKTGYMGYKSKLEDESRDPNRYKDWYREWKVVSLSVKQTTQPSNQ